MRESEPAKLTKRLLKSARPTSHDYVIWDTELPGFGARVWPAQNGLPARISFILHYRAGRRQRKLTLGRFGALSVEAARKLALQAKADVARGGDPALEKSRARQGLSISEVVPRYLAVVETKKKLRTAHEYERLLKTHVVPVLGRRLVNELDTADVLRLHEKLSETPVQANRVLAILSSLCTWAAQSNLRDAEKVNPCSGVEWYRETSRERFLTAEELVRLGDALRRAEREGLLPPPERRRVPKTGETAKLRPLSADTPTPANPVAVNALRLLMLTGARKNEVLRLRWEDVDLERKQLRLKDSKTGTSTRPLGAPAAQLLASLPRIGPYVFPGRDPETPLEGVRRQWDAVRHAAKLKDVRLHDLRHTLASIAAGEGQSLLLIGKMLGHKRPTTTARYAHLADSPVQTATDRTSRTIAKFLGIRPKRRVS